VIGEEAQNNIGLLQRYVREGTRSPITPLRIRTSANLAGQLELELNWTERLFAAETGIQPLYFRPPYSIDQEPDTNDEAAPAYRIQQMGYTIIGTRSTPTTGTSIRANRRRKSRTAFLQQLDDMKTHPWMRGSIILLHDGAEPRADSSGAATFDYDAAAKGYEIVPSRS